MEKKDWLGVCNEHQIALEDFRQQFCVRCVQKECTRSQFGLDRFGQRVGTWVERLFSAVPTMSPDDKRYLPIHNARFFEIQPSLGSISTSTWEYPSSGAESSPTPIQEVAPVPKPKFETIVRAEEPPPEGKVEAIVPPPIPPAPTPKVPSSSVPTNILLANTNVQQGRMLNRPQPLVKPAEKKDGWEGLAPSQPSKDPIVQPGAKVKLGGG